MNEFKIGNKVRLQKKGEHSGFSEVGRGTVISLADGKSGQWIKFLERDVENPDCAEWICVNAPNIKVLLW